MPPVRVFLADDHPLVLAGLRALLDAESDLAVVGEAGDGRTAVRDALRLRPDVAVLDMSMPGLNGLEVVKALRDGCPECRCIALTMHDDRVYVRRMLDVGAVGYVVKRSAGTELVRAIRAVMRGDIYVDPAVIGHVVTRADGRGAARGQSAEADLTPREAEVLQLAVKGHSHKAVAALLGIAVKTVDAHRARAMEKLGFTTRVELLRYAVEQGWLEAGPDSTGFPGPGP